jgi:hypothetical protein
MQPSNNNQPVGRGQNLPTSPPPTPNAGRGRGGPSAGGHSTRASGSTSTAPRESISPLQRQLNRAMSTYTQAKATLGTLEKVKQEKNRLDIAKRNFVAHRQVVRGAKQARNRARRDSGLGSAAFQEASTNYENALSEGERLFNIHLELDDAWQLNLAANSEALQRLPQAQQALNSARDKIAEIQYQMRTSR